MSEHIAETFAEWATDLTLDAIPERVTRRARVIMLDTFGVGMAAESMPFARQATAAVTGLAGLAGGTSSGIGYPALLPLRDAVLLNGTLVHGLDFDDTYTRGQVHTSASAVPTALGLAEANGSTADDLILGYIVGAEVTGRVAAAATSGAMIGAGFQPTGVAGAFGCAVLAGRLLALSPAQITAAQGFVGSMAAGSMSWAAGGYGNKRTHPGWSGVSGIVAATFAQHGFDAAPDIYEGPRGLYATHTIPGSEIDFASCSADLGRTWVVSDNAVKPIPACHFAHSLSDAARLLVEEHRPDPLDIERVTCLVAEPQVPIIFEPLAAKQRPTNAYGAQFSGPYVVASSLLRGRFTLEELSEDALADAAVLQLASKVTYEIDPRSDFPRNFSGEVIIEMADGTTYSWREQINRGMASRPMTDAEVEEKFLVNATGRVSDRQATQLRDAVLEGGDPREIGRLLRER